MQTLSHLSRLKFEFISMTSLILILALTAVLESAPVTLLLTCMWAVCVSYLSEHGVFTQSYSFKKVLTGAAGLAFWSGTLTYSTLLLLAPEGADSHQSPTYAFFGVGCWCLYLTLAHLAKNSFPMIRLVRNTILSVMLSGLGCYIAYLSTGSVTTSLATFGILVPLSTGIASAATQKSMGDNTPYTATQTGTTTLTFTGGILTGILTATMLP